MTKKRPDKHAPSPSAEGAGKPPEPEPPAQDTASERDDLLARLQRVSADYLNYQKRARREIEEAHTFANTSLVRDLLGVLDDMERALEAAAANHNADDPLLGGMRLVYDKALEVLARHGVTRIQAEGQPFDPNRHEAMMQQPSPDCRGPTVLQEFQRGYELNGRVIRPARVVVGMPAPAEDPDDPAAGDEHDLEGE